MCTTFSVLFLLIYSQSTFNVLMILLIAISEHVYPSNCRSTVAM